MSDILSGSEGSNEAAMSLCDGDKMYRLIGTVLLLVAVLTWPASAREMRLTIYDDGKSCPGNCDAHVVINPQDNGTRHAFRPDSNRTNPRPCIAGQICRICFGEAGNTCMAARYRGGGPPRGTFDFTPAFYNEHCNRADIPQGLRRQCAVLDAAVQNLGYRDRVNCFDKPDNNLCRDITAAARAAQQADTPKRDRCLSLGQAAYNQRQTDPRERRTNACNYTEERLGGPNRQGVRWRKLLPAACPEGTFVGRDGLDCCSSNLRFVASVHPECVRYFPRRS
jgi:hypothetical protein